MSEYIKNIKISLPNGEIRELKVIPDEDEPQQPPQAAGELSEDEALKMVDDIFG